MGAAGGFPRQGYLASLLILAFGVETAHSQKAGCAPVGELDILPFRSDVFAAARSLRILLPPGYRLPANKERRYPVLYLNDGQDLFGACTDKEWRVDRTVAALIREHRIPPIIVVGIDHGHRARAKEYLPWGDETLQPPEPDAAGKYYPAFLLDEVVPFVESRYRISKGAAHRVLGGSSYGAGIALFTAMERPGSFAGLLLESPSLSADNYHLLRNAEVVHVWPRRIYIGTGTVREPLQDVRRLEALLRNKGVAGAGRLLVRVQQGAMHNEKYWAQRLPEALRFLFAP